uniref:Uncharacterized protein n=1 Tax=Trieres chinensis TaxID=1514140 RepID=A0A6U1SRY8_TRICV|mmetsp:Transcript_10501/g.22033  ORF Transcript_10501/g.22033 Transcript_10501/m.22033 type:complete len:322 (+) Transcript_10501:182-1147(+)|eukprot:CAMPEP_0183291618 /NCGR_PEP_ID=MMETSP0160_2-20130417/973_1 /TAXON_ID=2839 ORGANISM="Odontella Sinensis, Strain Grunow 1884" /NCGR_SAMPLE_ID=MMETSP0160_2 /ASSEMBLY_ACC=CAM_ASM_000250 /LENGTH=321 /DNA_ID=CAMNT_0025452451 /DNA_START=166 /DNA_END=1131 /DNA_ORIENTATION=+
MTASNPAQIGNGAPESREDDRPERQRAALTKPEKAHGLSASSGADCQLESARARFAAAVSLGVSELTARFGYSRERAAWLLLGEIRRDDSPPSDDEIFRAMEYLGLGMEEASKTVTVARALRRARLEQGLSAVDAIDDLTAKLSVSSLVGKVGSLKSLIRGESVISEVSVGPTDASAVVTLAAPSGGLGSEKVDVGVSDFSLVVRTTNSTSKKNHGAKLQKAFRQKNVSRTSSVKGANRKRLLAESDDNNAEPSVPIVVGKDKVNVELTKKSKISGDQDDPSEQGRRGKSPTQIVRTKRSASLLGDEPQPALKRSRADSEL